MYRVSSEKYCNGMVRTSSRWFDTLTSSISYAKSISIKYSDDMIIVDELKSTGYTMVGYIKGGFVYGL